MKQCVSLWFLICLCLILTATDAAAATFAVNTINDTSDAAAGDGVCADQNGDCSLRAAVEEANALTGDDAIAFDATVFNTARTIVLDTNKGELNITGNVVIAQNSARPVVTISIDPNGFFTNRIFEIQPNAQVTLTRLIIRDGVADTDGGGVRNLGALTLNAVTVTGNKAQNGNGGGVYNSGGTLTINAATVSNNTAATNGGGVYNQTGATLNVNNSTVSGNTSGNGGGVYNSGGTAALINSTISGNAGGGLYNFSALAANPASLTLTNVTVAFNSNGNGGGVVNSAAFGAATATLNNTIIAKNSASSGPDVLNTANAPFVSNGFNLIGDTTGAFIAATATDKFGTAAAPVDPKLNSLADNGGATQTHSLQIGSPAIDAGSSVTNSQTTDQRGFARPFDNPNIANQTGGNGADIGAFEVQAATAADVTISGRIFTAKGRGVFRARVQFTDQNAVTRFAVTNNSGYYRFANVPAGATIVFTVNAKNLRFTPQPVTLNSDRSDLNFTALP